MVDHGTMVEEDLSVQRCEQGGQFFEAGSGSGTPIWEPLQIQFPDYGRGDLSTWVLRMVSSFRHMVGISCEGYESELLDLFVALERDRGSVGSLSPTRSGGKMMRELKGLKSSINYDGGDASSRRNSKGGRAPLLC